jgi:hypothetical protein
MAELTRSDGIIRSHEVSEDGSNTTECSARTVGLTLADGKRTLAGLQDHLVRRKPTNIAASGGAALSAARSRRPRTSARARSFEVMLAQVINPSPGLAVIDHTRH